MPLGRQSAWPPRQSKSTYREPGAVQARERRKIGPDAGSVAGSGKSEARTRQLAPACLETPARGRHGLEFLTSVELVIYDM
jgi:hypothetical protein